MNIVVILAIVCVACIAFEQLINDNNDRRR